MELVIRVDLDKAKQTLPEILKLVGECLPANQLETAAEAEGLIRDSRQHIIGEWNIEEAETTPHALDSAYRTAATERYVQLRAIEVDRFATVSRTDDGAYVQGWLYVPQSAVNSLDAGSSVSRKPPVSVLPQRNAEKRVG